MMDSFTSFTEEISIYNLDGSLMSQRHLLKTFPHQIIDCHDIRGKNLYCETQSLRDIYSRYMSSADSFITLIGSGNYHYVTYLHLKNIKEPFTLLLFDHHTDLMENKYLLTCGSWVAKALRDIPNFKKAIIIGPNPDELEKVPLDLQDYVTIFPDNWNSPKLLESIYFECETEQIHISIDKDVLDEPFSKTNWDHGHMDLNILIECLTSLMKETKIHSVDICGEWLVSPGKLYTPENQEYTMRNEKANIALLQTLSSGIRNRARVTNNVIKSQRLIG